MNLDLNAKICLFKFEFPFKVWRIIKLTDAVELFFFKKKTSKNFLKLIIVKNDELEKNLIRAKKKAILEAIRKNA